MLLDLTDDYSTLVQVMAWCRQAISHYLRQCWPRSISPYGVSKPQCVHNYQVDNHHRLPGPFCLSPIAPSACMKADIWTYTEKITLPELTHIQLEMHGCVQNAAATDALVLKHRGCWLNSHFTGPPPDKDYFSLWNTLDNIIKFWRKITQLFKG